MPKTGRLPPYPADCAINFAFKFSRSKNTEITQAAQKKTCMQKYNQCLSCGMIRTNSKELRPKIPDCSLRFLNLSYDKLGDVTRMLLRT